MSQPPEAIASCPSDDALALVACDEPAAPGTKEHVGACPACRERLEALREVLAGLREMAKKPTQAASRPAAAREDMPESIGKYKIVARLGSGGQAEVYRAVHPVLGRDVVVKVSRRPAPQGAEGKARLVEEGRCLAELDHPGIARVHDVDFHEGRPFLVLEYDRGRSLAHVARDERIAPRRAARIVAAAARALHAAHAKGLVHRDVKPENVLLGDDGRPRVIDFGIALLRSPWDEAGVVREVSGTAEFMAPEQARGETERVGPRSDVFALGGVLHFLLTGRPPFHGRTVTECISRARACQVDWAALASAGAPRALERACRKAMAAEPGDRFASAEALARALEAFAARPARLWMAAAAAVLLVGAWAAWGFLPGMGAARVASPDLPRAQREPFRVEEASLWRIDLTGPARLLDGDRIQVGDKLMVRFQADHPVHVYVLNEDEKGHRSCLFPGPGLDQRNPLAGGAAHDLPGTLNGRRKAWDVTSSGGRESLFIVASLAPIEALEKAAASRVLEPDGLKPLLRSIDGLSDVDAEAIAKGKDLLSRVVEELRRGPTAGEAARGQWLRKITLQNPEE